MARRAFYSFYYKDDNQRAAKVRNMGVIEGNRPATDNEWEKITDGRDPAIEKWISEQLDGKSCTVVLIGAATAHRKWVEYEIIKTWNDKKGVVGVYIHNLTNLAGEQSSEGANPFDYLRIGEEKMSPIVKAYDPPFTTSKYVYSHIQDNLESWIEEAVKIRANYY